MTNYQIYQTQFCSYSVSPIAGFWSHETYCNIGAGIWACFQVGYLNREIIIYIYIYKTTKSTTIIDALDHPNHPLCLVYFGYMGWIPLPLSPPCLPRAAATQQPQCCCSCEVAARGSARRRVAEARRPAWTGTASSSLYARPCWVSPVFHHEKRWYMGITKKEMRCRWNNLRKSAGNRGFCPSDFGDFLCILPSTNSEI